MEIRPDQPKNQLIVLLPDVLVNNSEVVRQVCWLAVHEKRQILYLTIVEDEGDMALIGCYMDTMKSATTTESTPVQYQVTASSHWLSSLLEICQPSDRIVCQAEQVVRTSAFSTMPFIDFLAQKISLPIVTISGIYHPARQQLHIWLHEALAWLGFMLIILLFTWVEIQIEPAMPGWLGKFFLSITVVIEIGLLWAWNTVLRMKS